MHEKCVVDRGRSACSGCKDGSEQQGDAWARFRSLGFILRAPDHSRIRNMANWRAGGLIRKLLIKS